MNASNTCTFIGRLTKSPLETLKKLDNGNSFLSISIAVKSPAIDKEGQAYERTDFPQLTFWNEKASAAALNYSKGSLVEVAAQLQTRRYQADDGKTWRYVTEFLVQSIQLKGAPESESQQLALVPAKAPAQATKSHRTKTAAR